MKRDSCLTLFSVTCMLMGVVAFGQTGTRQAPISEKPLGYFYCDKKSGMCSLKANEFNMKKPVKFSVQELCKYNVKDKKWLYLALNSSSEKVISRKPRQVYGGDTDQTVQAITDSIGLFWVKWRENEIRFEGFLYSGMLCNDVHIGPERKGDWVATCIPGKNEATAAYVSDPRVYCVKPDLHTASAAVASAGATDDRAGAPFPVYTDRSQNAEVWDGIAAALSKAGLPGAIAAIRVRQTAVWSAHVELKRTAGQPPLRAVVSFDRKTWEILCITSEASGCAKYRP